MSDIDSISAQGSKVVINVDYNDVLSYAYAGTRRPLIRKIEVTNSADDLPVATQIRPLVFVESAVEGELVSGWQGTEVKLPGVGEAPAYWDNISTPMIPKTVGRLEEPVAAEIVVQIFAGETLIGRQRLPLTVLAANEWMFRPDYLDALAAFVLPNSKAIVPVLQRARELLGERTGDRSTQGYQSGDSRAHQIAEAVYDALCEQRIDYSDPPASFDGYGQKIRSPRTILAEKVGTCLDTSVLLAACLAQVGLDPVIFLVNGHAFCGYLSKIARYGMQDTIVSDKAYLVELFAKENVHPIETTTICTGKNCSFSEARDRNSSYFSESLAEESLANMKGMVVVRRCWQMGIMPPPVLSDQLTSDVEGEITQSGALSAGQEASDGTLDDAWEPALRGGPRPPPRVRSWLASLLDLTRNNRLLDIKVKDYGALRSTGRVIEFQIPRGLIGEIDDALFEEDGKIEIASPFKLPGEVRDAGMPENDLKLDFRTSRRLFFPPYSWLMGLPSEILQLQRKRPDVPPSVVQIAVQRERQEEYSNTLNKKLTNLQKQAREVEEQSGSNPLFLALGLLGWTEEQKQWSAPLFLYPAKILGEGRAIRRLVLDQSGDVTPNYCLREKFLRPPHSIDLSVLELPDRDAHGIDLVKMLDVIRAKLKEGGAVDVTVSERCFLGVFNYSSFRLWKDIRDHWETFRETSPVVRHLMLGATSGFADGTTDESGGGNVVCPIIADDSQIDAIRRAMNGESFVLQGPPGTGKTQTIANLLASCLASGKKVLFVAEKRTALDQVKKRLAQVGLSNYCLDLHSSGDSDARIRKNMLEQFNAALESDADPRDQNWADLDTRRQQHETDLDRYCNALHDNNNAGFSAWSSHEQVMELGTGPSATVDSAFLGQHKVLWPELLKVAITLPSLVQSAGGLAGNHWRFVEQVNYAKLNRETFGAAVQDWVQAAAELESLPEPWDKLHAVAAPDGLHLFGDWVQLASAGAIPAPAEFDAIGKAQWHKQALKIFAELTPLVEQFLGFSRCLNPSFYLRPDIPELAQAARDAKSHAQGMDQWHKQVLKIFAELTPMVEQFLGLSRCLNPRFYLRADIPELAQAARDAKSHAKDMDQWHKRALKLFTELTPLVEKFLGTSRCLKPRFYLRADIPQLAQAARDAEATWFFIRRRHRWAIREKIGSDAAEVDLALLCKAVIDVGALKPQMLEICGKLAMDGFNLSPDWNPMVPGAMQALAEEAELFVKLAKNSRSEPWAATIGLHAAEADLALQFKAVIDVDELKPQLLEICGKLAMDGFDLAPDWNPMVPDAMQALAEQAELIVKLAKNSRSEPWTAAVGLHAAEADVALLFKAVIDVATLKPQLLEICGKLSTVTGFNLAPDWNPMVPGALQALAEQAELLVKLAKHCRSEPWLEIADALNMTESPDEAIVNSVAQAARAWDTLAGHVTWSAASLKRWAGAVPFSKCWGATAPAIALDCKAEGGVANRFLKLQRWALVLEALEKIGRFGFAQLQQQILAGSVDLNEIETILRRGIAQLSLQERLETGNLDSFDGHEHDRRVTEYIKAERDARELLKLRIPGLVRQRNPRSRLTGGRVFGETEELKRQLVSKRQRAPVRSLLKKFGERLAGLMPCFLMSSDSVASFLPPGSVKFDLVVFDEASQIEVARAIGALGRGIASIVVGDSFQMPPTRFGAPVAGANQSGLTWDDENPEQNSDLDGEDAMAPRAQVDEESILTELQESGIEQLQLLCHYRSKDESLIAFSNKYIYPKPMLTFPAPGAGKVAALSFRKVDGQFLRSKERLDVGRADLWRTNPAEAEAVVAEVKRRLTDPQRIVRRDADPTRTAETIVVVTFNVQQMNLVQELLVEDEPDDSVVRRALVKETNEETGIQNDPQVKIRNLENVQGDEAETVLFSVAFSKLEPVEGKASSANVPLRFGPLGNVGGHRRLNVAVTRAQREMIVFCSFLPEDMPVKESSAEGVKLLQKFLVLARNGVAKNAEIAGRGAVSAHVQTMGRAIANLGFRVDTNLGLSNFKVDIAIGLPDTTRWELAILVDGLGWHSRGTAYQRDVLPPAVLRELGWQKVMRVWLPSWIADSDGVLAEINGALRQIAAGAAPEPLVDEVATQPGPDRVPDSIPQQPDLPAVHESSLPGQVAFRQYVVRAVYPKHMLYSTPTAVSRATLEQVFGEILSAESPIEVMRFAKLVGNTFGLERVLKVRATGILKLVDKKLRTKSALGEFIWATGIDPNTWVEFRAVTEGVTREVHEIPPEEYRNAMVALVDAGGSIGDEEILHLVGDIFGFAKIGARVKKHFDDAIAWSCAAGSITKIDDRYFRGA